VTLALVVAIPLGTAVAIALVGGRLGRRTLGIVTTLALGLAFGAGASMIASLNARPSLDAYLGPWLPIAGADFALTVDGSMLAVALALTGVAARIALYSIDYLARDRGLQRYFATFALLVGGTLLVVLGSNLLLVVMGWELAGVSRYLLVGHHRDDPRAGGAALKAFVVERIGDAAFVAGTLLLLAEFHTVDIAQLGGVAIEHGSGPSGLPVLASALILIGALSKSAQFPLHVWLPDATEATTPVSALMQSVGIASGVILLMRLRSVLAPDVLQAAAILGAVTALGGAIVAIAQRDIRRVLAWSTISQVGLMFVAAGLGALFAARFQLIAHAFLKAILVLGAGSVRRATGDESDIAKYGGLGRRMPWTAGAFAIGVLALAGIPPAAGFFGIAAIVSAAFSVSDALLTALVLLALAAGAFAGVRLFALTFVAPPAASAREPHEPRPLQDLPLVLLAVAAIAFGPLVSSGLLSIGTGPADTAPLWLLSATFVIALAGAVAAWLGYRHGPARAARIERISGPAAAGLGFDALYRRAVVEPFANVARELERGAERANGAAVDAVAAAIVRTSRSLRVAGPDDARVRQVVLLAGTVVLLVFWTLSSGSAR